MKKSFHYLGIAEGISLLTLFCIAMPLKYLAHEPMAVRITGSIHGMLFLAYMGVAVAMAGEDRWPMKRLFQCLLFACLPFGTFIFEKKILPRAAS